MVYPDFRVHLSVYIVNFTYRYLKEVKIMYQAPDKRDPEFVLYDVTKAIVNIYR